MTEVLKLCPFCDGEPKLLFQGELSLDYLGSVRVLCKKCLCGTYPYNFANQATQNSQAILAIEAWNKRA